MTKERPVNTTEQEAYTRGYARAQRDLDLIQSALEHSPPIDLRKVAADLLRGTSDMCDASGPDAAEDWLLGELRRLVAAARAPAFEVGFALGMQTANAKHWLNGILEAEGKSRG